MRSSIVQVQILKFVLLAVLFTTIFLNALFFIYGLDPTLKDKEGINLILGGKDQRKHGVVHPGRADNMTAALVDGVTAKYKVAFRPDGTGETIDHSYIKESESQWQTGLNELLHLGLDDDKLERKGDTTAQKRGGIPPEKTDYNTATSREKGKETNAFVRKASSEVSPVFRPEDQKWITVEAQSERKHIYASVDGEIVYQHEGESDQSRGMHIVVLSQRTGKVTASRIFDVFAFEQDDAIAKFLDSLQDGRIVVFIVKDEGAYNLKKIGRNAIKAFGSRLIANLEWRNSWAFIGQKRCQWLVEDLHKPPKPDEWPVPAKARVSLMLVPNSDACDYGSDDEGNRRREFCSTYDGYGNVCKCSNFDAINIKAKPLNNNKLSNIPVAIIASNRPYYLYRMLRKLLSAHGADPKMMTVYIDDFNPAPAAVAKLLNVCAIQHKPVCSKNCRIQQHYKKSLTQTFDEYPKASAMIILEEDLEVSTDIFDYFSQTLPLLETDASVYCVSAWNDQGYRHAVKDPAMLYRVETMPGLGWLLKRNLYKDELEPKWPGPTDHWDWDMWMRQDYIRKGRECIIPEVSRTFHFGSQGLNINYVFQKLYFSTRSLNDVTGVNFDVEKMKKDNYEQELETIIRGATLLDHTKNQCTHKDEFIPNTKDKTYIAYFQLDEPKQNEAYGDISERYGHWLSLAACFKIWDLDTRGFHHGLIRISFKDNHIIFIGAPASPYSRYKPERIKPIYLPRTKKI
eukprot:Seg846.7 transcript_id=Seg846.7/GoldUCD/mRNA.D3Y31 product="Protein O-linked-mannose beta-1 2-N-acetylglucosaminyltransferase 1" protein_id=Seg846.7/GoldUCD/D3Y31